MTCQCGCEMEDVVTWDGINWVGSMHRCDECDNLCTVYTKLEEEPVIVWYKPIEEDE